MLQILADGLIIGSVISPGAIGLSLTLSIVRFSNFSHGELLGWGSYVALSALAVFTATRESLATPLGPFTFGWGMLGALVVSMAVTALLALALTLATVTALHLFLRRSTLGRAMRATAINPGLARVAGIDPERIGVHRRGRVPRCRRVRGADPDPAGAPDRSVRGETLMPDLLLGWLSYGSFFLVFASCFAIIVLGLNLQWGFTGLFNVGVAGFVALGAYTSALLTTPDTPERLGGLGWPVALGWLAAMGVSGIAGLFVGAVALRLRHDYLAITTFGVAVAIQLVAKNATALTGGPFGVQFIPKPMQGWPGTGLPWTLAYLALTLVLLGIVYLALERLVRSPWGRALRAIREDESAAASLGKRPFVFRLQSFVIGSMLMGLGGAVYAHFVGYIAPEDFLPILTFQLWAMLIVGGSGNNRGAVIGAFVVWTFWAAAGGLLRGWVRQAEQARAAALQVVLIGVLIALMLVLRPRGLIGEEVTVSRSD